MSENLYQKFSPVNLTRIFALAAFEGKSIGPMTFMLVGGRSIDGYLIRAKEEAPGYWNLLVRPSGTSGNPGSGLVFFPGHHVVAVSVDSLEIAAQYFGFQSVAPTDLEPPLGSLELKRHVDSSTQVMQSLFDGKLRCTLVLPDTSKQTESVRKSIGDFISALTTALQELSLDDFSKNAIVESIDSILVEPGATPAVAVKDRTLRITAHFDSRNGGFTDVPIKVKIEKAF